MRRLQILGCLHHLGLLTVRMVKGTRCQFWIYFILAFLGTEQRSHGVLMRARPKTASTPLLIQRLKDTAGHVRHSEWKNQLELASPFKLCLRLLQHLLDLFIGVRFD